MLAGPWLVMELKIFQSKNIWLWKYFVICRWWSCPSCTILAASCTLVNHSKTTPRWGRDGTATCRTSSSHRRRTRPPRLWSSSLSTSGMRTNMFRWEPYNVAIKTRLKAPKKWHFLPFLCLYGSGAVCSGGKFDIFLASTGEGWRLEISPDMKIIIGYRRFLRKYKGNNNIFFYWSKPGGRYHASYIVADRVKTGKTFHLFQKRHKILLAKSHIGIQTTRRQG